MAGANDYPSSSWKPVLETSAAHPYSIHQSRGSASSSTLASRPQQNPRRSCTECCRRKVRCNRAQPCANCMLYKSTCVFPKFRQPARRQGRVEKRSNEASDISHALQETAGSTRDTDNIKTPVEATTSSGGSGAFRRDATRQISDETNAKDMASKGDAHVQLIHDQDRSRYVSNSFWATMSGEVDEMRDILDVSSPASARDSTPENAEITSRIMQASRESFIFNAFSLAPSISSLYPSGTMLLTMFDLFQENVDPVVRIFHRPTLRKTITDALSSSSGLGKQVEVIMFSLCYAAVTSIDEDETKRLLDEEQQVLLRRYRYATEQSLAKAGFLESQNLGVLAALVLYLICVRRHDQTRFVSALLGVVIRNAQGMGLHKDGTHFQLSPLEIESRRRLWWHICILDLRASEDHGCDPSLFENNYDTRFPLNLNDDDISDRDLQVKPERLGTSDMTFCLLRFEVTIAIRRLHYHTPGNNHPLGMDPTQLRSSIESMEKHFHEQYIKHCDVTRPIEWVSATWARLMLAKMWLAVYNPLILQGGKLRDAPLHSRQLAFTKSIEVLELADLLETSHRAARWRWLFLTHAQWHVVVFVLAYLCVRPDDTSSTRAWSVVDNIYTRWSSNVQTKQGMLWKPARRLMFRANQVRNVPAPLQRRATPRQPESISTNNQSRIPVSGSKRADDSHIEQIPTPLSETTTGQGVGEKISKDISAGDEHSAPFSAPETTEALFENSPPKALPPTGSDVEAFAPTDSQLGIDLDSDGFGSEMIWSDDWSTIMEELQMDLQDIEEAPTVCPADTVQPGMRHLWNTL